MTVETLTSSETLVIETPERVPLEFALASIGNRFLACAFDHAMQFVIIIIALLVVYVTGNFDLLGEKFFDAPKWLQAALIIFLFVVFSGYFVLFESFWNGQTPGKRLLKLRVIREDGRPITFWEAAVRNLIRLFDMMPAVAIPLYSVGLISVFASKRDQRLGDLFAGTLVVREREAEAPSFDQVFNSPTSDTALRRSFKQIEFTGNVKLVSEPEIEVIENFLRRRWDLPDRPREWMAWRIALPVLYKMQPVIDPRTFTYEAFLEELLHRYRAQPRRS